MCRVLTSTPLLSPYRSSLTGILLCSPPSSTSCGPKSSTHALSMCTCSFMRLSFMASRRWVRHSGPLSCTDDWTLLVCVCHFLSYVNNSILQFRSFSCAMSSTDHPVGMCSSTATCLLQVNQVFLALQAAPHSHLMCVLSYYPSVPGKATQSSQRGGFAVNGRPRHSCWEGTCQTQQHHATKPGEFWDTQQSQHWREDGGRYTHTHTPKWSVNDYNCFLEGRQCDKACVCVCVGQVSDPGMVRIICGHHNWIAVAYAQFVVCYRWTHDSVMFSFGCLSVYLWKMMSAT